MKMGAFRLAVLCFALLISSTHGDPQAIPIEAVELIEPEAPTESPPLASPPLAVPVTPVSSPLPSPTTSTPVPTTSTPAPNPASLSGPLLYWDHFTTLFGEKHIKYPGSPSGSTVEIALDNTTGSGFQSKYPYLYGHLSMKVKLVADNSAGTVTSYYLASIFTNWCELDFEFLGNVTGEPYILQTNVFSEGKGEREQRMYLWFDPSADYHEYGILWNEKLILFLVDDVVIRVYHNLQEELGVPYLTYQPMFIYTSIWNGEQWATRGGADKTDWSKQPFVASYTDFDVLDACPVKGVNNTDVSPCYAQLSTSWYNDAAHQTLTEVQIDDLKRIKENYIIYDYCTDYERFPTSPVECVRNWPF